MKVFRVFLLLVGILALSLPAFAIPPSANLPLDSWVYPALDKLSGLGLVQSSLQGDRPYTRLEAARQVAEAQQYATLHGEPPVVDQLLGRLASEFHEELGELADGGAASTSYFQPIRDFSLKYVYKDGQDSTFPGTDAHRFLLNSNNFGIRYANHQNGQATFQGDARLGGIFLLSWRPLLQVGQKDGANGGTALRLLQGKAALQLGPVEISFGRQPLWWGVGRHGSLDLTDNAKPLDMLRITNPTPILLPWIFKYLGPFRFDMFWSKLEGNRVVPHPYFSGFRLEFKPVPWFEIGGSKTMIFGGEGRPGVTFKDFIIGDNVSSPSQDTSDSIAGLDFHLHIPSLYGATVYGEWYGEDEANYLPSRTSQIYGLYLPVLEPTERVSLRLEYADLDFAGQGPMWYRHWVYKSGYTYEEDIMGHPVGGDSRDLYAELQVILPQNLTLGLSFDLQERGYHEAVRERHVVPGLEVEWQLQNNLALTFDYKLDRVSNFNFVQGDRRTFSLAEAGVDGHW